jgi:hypothetical protein
MRCGRLKRKRRILAKGRVIPEGAFRFQFKSPGFASFSIHTTETPGRWYPPFKSAKGRVLLTISLAEVPIHGFHYKLVAGVVNLPS